MPPFTDVRGEWRHVGAQAGFRLSVYKMAPRSRNVIAKCRLCRVDKAMIAERETTQHRLTRQAVIFIQTAASARVRCKGVVMATPRVVIAPGPGM